MADDREMILGLFKYLGLFGGLLKTNADNLSENEKNPRKWPNSFSFSRKVLNIVVVGQSGVGKSSFLNYVAGKEYFRTGVGGAVTKGYFESYTTKRNNVDYQLFDTEGLESGSVVKWQKNILSEIKRRDSLTDMSEWFHSVLFCISAESKRVQPFEIDAIKRLASSGHVIVLLTKMDKVDPHDLQSLKTEILNQVGDQVEILSVCSVAQKFRNGTQTTQHGLDEVLSTSFIGLWKKMAILIPSILLSEVLFYKNEIHYSNSIKSLISWGILNQLFPRNLDIKEFCRLFNFDTYSISNSTNVPYDKFVKAHKIKELEIYPRPHGIGAKGNACYGQLLKLPSCPSKENLDWGLLRGGIANFLIDWQDIKRSLIGFLNELNESTIIESLNSAIETCSKLYIEVTGERFTKTVSFHDIQSNIKTLKAISAHDSLTWYYNKVKQSIAEVDSCTFFSGKERDRLILNYGNFKSAADDFCTEYSKALESTIKSIQQELRSFADYTLRNTFPL